MPRCAIVVALLLALPCCGGSNGPQDDAGAPAGPARSEAEDPGKESRAEADRGEGKAAGDADGKEPEDPTKGGGAETPKPLSISEIDVVQLGDTLGSKGAIKITAKAKLNQPLDNSTYVHAKAICKKGDTHLADTGYINANYQKPLQQYAVGETVDLEGSLFTQGVDAAMSPCQFDFRLAGPGGGVSIPLRTACFDHERATLGPCKPPVIAPALSGKGKDLEISSVNVRPQSGFGSKGGIDTSYVLKVSKPAEDNTRLTFKAACKVEETKFVDLGQANLMAGPFKYESGESVARAATLFWNPMFGFADSPALCDLTVAAWRPKKGAFGQSEQEVLRRSCYRDGKIMEGKCNPREPAAPPPGPVTVESLVIDNVLLEVVEPYGSKGDRFQLKLQADAKVEKPVDQQAGIEAKVTCKVGKTARVETAYLYGVELYYLEPGETARLTSVAFTSNAMEGTPRSCEALLTGGRRISPTGDERIDLGKWCLKKDKVKKGRC